MNIIMKEETIPLDRSIILAGDRHTRELVKAVEEYLTHHNAKIVQTVPFFGGVEDYITQAIATAEWVSDDPYNRAGILLCGTGSGVTIVSNKFPGVYAVTCRSVEDAVQSREINNSNILTLGSTKVSKKNALDIVEHWLKTPFNYNRNEKRFTRIRSLEEKLYKL